MAGLGDTIKDFVLGTVPGDAARKTAGAMNGATGSVNNGHTTSGMDQAMSDHADKMHPVKGRMPLPSDDNSFPK